MRTSRCSRLALAGVVLLAVGCGGTSAPASEPAGTSSSAGGAAAGAGAGDAGSEAAAVAEAADAAATQPAPPADPLAEVRARGTLHGEPIAFRAARGEPGPTSAGYDVAAGQLVFLGSADEARAAWWVSERGATPVANWPSAVRVLGAVAHDNGVYVLVETLALLDQPAGLRSVVALARTDAGLTLPDARDWPLRVAGVRDVAELERRLQTPEGAAGAREEPPEGYENQVRLCRALARAAASPASLSRFIAAGGVDVGTSYQRGVVALTHVDAAGFARSPRAAEVARAVREIVGDGNSCYPFFNSPPFHTDPSGGDNWGAVLGFERGNYVVRAVFMPPPAGALNVPAPAAVEPRAVESGPATEATMRALRERFAVEPTLVREARLSASGDDAVAYVLLPGDADSVRPEWLLLHEGGHIRVVEVRGAPYISGPPTELRFADVDGDGRTDVVGLYPTSNGVDENDQPAAGPAYVHVISAPAPTVFPRRAWWDEAAEFAALGSSDLDAALRAIFAFPRRGVTAREACRVLQGARTYAALQRTAPHVKLLTFNEPDDPTLVPEVHTLAEIEPDNREYVGTRYPCTRIRCEPRRPMCHNYPPVGGPDSEAYWFTWEGNRLVLAGLATYGGS